MNSEIRPVRDSVEIRSWWSILQLAFFFFLCIAFVINRCGTDVRVFDEAGVKGGEEDDTKKLYGKFGKVASSFCPNFRFCLCKFLTFWLLTEIFTYFFRHAKQAAFD